MDAEDFFFHQKQQQSSKRCMFPMPTSSSSLVGVKTELILKRNLHLYIYMDSMPCPNVFHRGVPYLCRVGTLFCRIFAVTYLGLPCCTGL